jgi:formate dehydrogenase (coenzyme F420) beta subunit
VNNYWLLETHGDPLGTVNKFINSLWYHANLEGMLVSQNALDEEGAGVRLLEDPKQFEQVNPFKPLMTFNASKYVPQSLNEHPKERLGVVLRPCEMRALTEMAKHTPINIDQLLTICVDCLGTYPADDVQWRTERRGSLDGLSYEALQFARQGGIVAYRYRSACQMCSSPDARGADINIFVIGLPVRQYLMIQTQGNGIAERYHFPEMASPIEDESLLSQRQKIIWKLSERHQNTRTRVVDGLADLIPSDIDALLAQFRQCGACQACLNACPICSVAFPRSGKDGLYLREDVVRWLVSCAGCGMCEQACVNHLPLSAIFGYIKQQLAKSSETGGGYSKGDRSLLL